LQTGPSGAPPLNVLIGLPLERCGLYLVPQPNTSLRVLAKISATGMVKAA